MKIYGEYGISNISFNEVCRKLDIAKPSIYRTFGNEDGLVAATLENYAAEVIPSMLAIIKSNRDFPAQLNELQDLILAVTEENREGCLLLQARRQKGNLGDKAKTLLSTIDKKFSASVMVWLEESKKRGHVRKNIKVASGAQLILSQIGFAQYSLSIGLSVEETREVMALSLSSLSH
jgi:AcrR family transcriptional regulator